MVNLLGHPVLFRLWGADRRRPPPPCARNVSRRVDGLHREIDQAQLRRIDDEAALDARVAELVVPPAAILDPLVIDCDDGDISQRSLWAARLCPSRRRALC